MCTKCLYILYMAVKECICIHVLFSFSVSSVSLWSCCKATRSNLLGSLSGQGFTSQHLLCLPCFLYLFLCTQFFAFARKAELSQTFVFTFGCAGLQLASPKLAFVHGVGRSGGLCSCACVYEHPWSWLSALQHSLCCLPVMLQQSPCYVYRASCALRLSEILL